MKLVFAILVVAAICNKGYAQYSGGFAYSSEVYSCNKKYRVQSYPFDNMFPTDRGISYVKDSLGIIYKINRSFDLDPDSYVQTAISNDGKKVIYITAIGYYSDFKNIDGLDYNHVVVYKEGKLFQSFTIKDFTGCDEMTEACPGIFYTNYNKTGGKRAGSHLSSFKDSAGDAEKYLSANYFVNINDTIYVTDARKIVTVYDLYRTRIIERMPFDAAYKKIKGHFNIKPVLTKLPVPSLRLDSLTDIVTGDLLSQAIEKISGFKFISSWGGNADYFRLGGFSIKMSGLLNKDGRLDITEIECDKALPKDKIVAYMHKARFNALKIPEETEQWYMQYFFGMYTYHDEQKAIQLKREQELLRAQHNDAESVAAYIDDVYIPADLQECMLELDKTLNFQSKQILKAATSTSDFNSHMGGLGMWIRNNWGLHRRSRLYQFFAENTAVISDDGGFKADIISGVVISCYTQWLRGNKDICKEWLFKNRTRK